MATLLRDIAFENVGAGLTASAKLKLGRTYDRLVLQLGGTFTKGQITDIQMKINGKLSWRATGARLDAMNKFRGLHDEAKFLTIDFTEQDFKTIEAITLGTFACTQEAGVQSATLEVTIAAGADQPKLNLVQQCSEPSANRTITRMIWSQIGIQGMGEFPVYVPYGRQNGGLIKRVWLFHGGIATELRIKRNNFELFDLTEEQNRFLQREKKRVPQDNVMVFDPVMSNLGSDALNARGTDTGAGVINSLDFMVKTTGAGTIDMYVEYYDDLARV